MTTGLFCFDGPLYKDKNGTYCSITLTNEMFNRYFSVVDKLYVVVRAFSSDKTYKQLNMKPLDTNNISVIEVKNLLSPKGILFGKRKFKKEIKNTVEKSDLIFARMPSQTSNAVLEMARKLKKQYLVEVGGCAWDSFWNHGIIGKLLAPYMYLSARRNIKKAQYATYVTKYFLQKRYPNNNVTTNCSNVYLSNINDNVLKQRLEKIEKMDIKHPVLGQAVNSIDVKYKGEHLIIRAMKALKEQGIIAEYQIVGPGKGTFLKKEAEKYGVSDQVKLIGALTKEEIFNWNKNIDIYVQPSKQEGLPRSVIEAMSTGCPCIGSNIAGIPELIDDNCIFNPDNNKNIIEVLLNINNKNEAIKQSKRNFQNSKQYNLKDIEKRRKRIFEIYKQNVKNTYPMLLLPGEDAGIYNFKGKQVNMTPIYRNDFNRILLRILRNTPLVWISLADWKSDLNKYRTIIVFDTSATYAMLNWISKNNRSKAKIIFCYRNSIISRKKNLKPNSIKKLGYEVWSYNKKDCKEYNMHYYSQMLDESMFAKLKNIRKEYKYDVIFIGREKGRGKLIKQIKQVLDSYGLNTFFYVPDMNDLDGNKCINNKQMQYEKYIQLLNQSKCILDLVTDDNYGLTYRPVEAMIAKKKLITNYEEISEYDFYNQNNIIIYKNRIDKKIVDFLNSDYSEIPQSIIRRYTISGWLDNFEDKQ